MTSVLQADQITKIFSDPGRPELTAVDHVSFQLGQGEILGVVGESGSGKSTLAKLVTRLIDVTDGSIRIDGEDVTHARGAALRGVYAKLQMVFQTPVGSFDPRRTLGDGIGESLKNRNVPKAERERRVEELLVQCGLPTDLAGRFPHEVSGGQCQRAAIARALACGPKILILDEATSSLDVTVQKQILELLKELQKSQELSYLFICHNLALVQQFCDRVLVMYEGKIVEEGSPDEVIMHPKEAYTRTLVESVF